MCMVIFKNRILKKLLSVGLSVFALCITLSPTVLVNASDNATLWYYADAPSGNPSGYIGVSSSTQYVTDYWDLVYTTLSIASSTNALGLNLLDFQNIFESIDGFYEYYSSYDNGFNPEVLVNVYYITTNQFLLLFKRSDTIVPNGIYIDSNGLYIPQFESNSFFKEFFVGTVRYLTTQRFTGYSTSWSNEYVNQYGFSDLVSSSPTNSIKAYLVTYLNDVASCVQVGSGNYNYDSVALQSPLCRSFDIPSFVIEDINYFVTRSTSTPANPNYQYGSYNNLSQFSTRVNAIYDYDHVLNISTPLYPQISGIPTVLPTISPTPLPIGYDVGIDGMADGSTLGFLQYLKDTLGNITETFSPVLWISATIGYIYHYSPWAKILLFIPMIAFLAFLIGRTKS